MSNGLEGWLASDPAVQNTPAWFGKLPALGDFAYRRGNERFNGAMDSWLQRSIPASRAQLGEGWTQAYLSAPMWCFALFPGVASEECYAGVLMSSVDRVGRYFPLIVYTQVPYARALLREIHSGMPWYRYIQQALPQVLNTQFTHDQFEALLAAAPVTALHAVDGLDAAVPVSWPEAFQQGRPMAVPGLDVATGALAQELLDHYLRGASLWWADFPNAGTLLRAYKGMPPPDAYAQWLTGHP